MRSGVQAERAGIDERLAAYLDGRSVDGIQEHAQAVLDRTDADLLNVSAANLVLGLIALREGANLDQVHIYATAAQETAHSDWLIVQAGCLLSEVYRRREKIEQARRHLDEVWMVGDSLALLARVYLSSARMNLSQGDIEEAHRFLGAASTVLLYHHRDPGYPYLQRQIDVLRVFCEYVLDSDDETAGYTLYLGFFAADVVLPVLPEAELTELVAMPLCSQTDETTERVRQLLLNSF